MSRITDPVEVGAENAAWRAYLQSKHAHHATDAFRAGWEAGRDWGRQNPDTEMASCECVHALKDHSKRDRRPCLICDDCPMFLWSGSNYRPVE